METTVQGISRKLRYDTAKICKQKFIYNINTKCTILRKRCVDRARKELGTA